jgi:hypothetical protein
MGRRVVVLFAELLGMTPRENGLVKIGHTEHRGWFSRNGTRPKLFLQ